MPAAMTYLRSLLLMMLAILALSGPSLAPGVAAATSVNAPASMAAVEEGAVNPGFRRCEGTGGKRVLPCPPDLGPLPGPAVQQLWAAAPAPAPADEALPAERAPKTDPPPPRRR